MTTPKPKIRDHLGVNGFFSSFQTINDFKGEIHKERLMRLDKLDTKNRRVLIVHSIPNLAAEEVRRYHHQTMDFCEFFKKIKDNRSIDIYPGWPFILYNFEPNVVCLEKAEDQIEALNDILDPDGKVGHPLVIISRTSPRLLMRELVRQAGQKASIQALNRWKTFLASFVVRFGKDPGDPEMFFKMCQNIKMQKMKISGKLHEGISDDDRWEKELETTFDWVKDECWSTGHLQQTGLQCLEDLDIEENYSHEKVISKIGFMARNYYEAIWSGCTVPEKVVLHHLGRDGMVNTKNYDHVLDLLQRGLAMRDPSLRLMSSSFEKFVVSSVSKSDLLEWEQAEGISAWSILKWILPLPLLLLGVFLFVTQRDAFSNTIAAFVALSSITPILFNIFDYLRQIASPSEGNGRREADEY